MSFGNLILTMRAASEKAQGLTANGEEEDISYHVTHLNTSINTKITN